MDECDEVTEGGDGDVGQDHSGVVTGAVAQQALKCDNLLQRRYTLLEDTRNVASSDHATYSYAGKI